MLHELPLVIFTICAQMSVGSFIVLGLIHLRRFNVPQNVMDQVTRPALWAIGPLLVLGLIASTLHLGSPLRAVNAIRHWDSSWLSREIILGMAFLGLGAAFAVTQWFGWLTHRLRQLLALAAAIVGAGLVYAISQVYSLRTVPSMATYHTPVRFFITTFLLGGLAVGAALVVAARLRARRGQSDERADAVITDSVRAIAVIGIVAMGLKFVGQPALMAYLGTHPDPAAQESLRLLSQDYGTWSALQNILIFAGVLLMGLMLFRMSGRNAGARWLPAIVVAALVPVFLGEVLGRMLFYASMVRTGM